MNDYEYTFNQDVREKKSIAHSARHKKNGSKSKYVSLPHDHLTKKQKEALNGPTKTICLGKAMSWNDFKGIRKDLQEEYLTTLRDRYSVTLKDIAEMLGTTHGRLSSYKSERKLNVSFPRGRKIMSLEQKEAWRIFCEGEPEVKVEEDIQVVEEPSTKEPEKAEISLKPVDWAVFKTWNVDVQKVYLKSIRGRFAVGTTLIAQMMSVEREEFYSYCVRNGLDAILKGATKPTDIQKEAWLAFCGSTIEEQVAVEPDNNLRLIPSSFSVEFNGYVTMADISAMIQKMTGNDYLLGKVRICYESEAK